MSALRASSVSVANAAAVAPRHANSSRARIRSRSAASVWPRSASNAPRLRSSCASQKASPCSRSVGQRPIRARERLRRRPGVPEHADPEYLRASLFERVQAPRTPSSAHVSPRQCRRDRRGPARDDDEPARFVASARDARRTGRRGGWCGSPARRRARAGRS